LVPPKDSHGCGENCEQRQEDSEQVACAGNRQLGDKLDYGDSRGQQTKRGALTGQKRSFVRQGEAVVRFDLGHTVVVAHQLNLSKLRPSQPRNQHWYAASIVAVTVAERRDEIVILQLAVQDDR